MKTTGNLGLKKPDGTDIVDITDLNGNMDILDTAVKAVQDHAADAVKHITAAERTGWNAKASTAAATASTAGLMAAADKAKLDGVAAGANNYVHPNHTGDVTSTGDGVTAIAPGVIVNADVNAAAAIDATKIGTGVVSNAEFAALDGVTGNVQAQLDNRPQLSNPNTFTNVQKITSVTGTNTAPALSIEGSTFNAALQIKNTTATTGKRYSLYSYNGGDFAIANETDTYTIAQVDGASKIWTFPAGVKSPDIPNKTTADITYYVRTDGSDSNTGLANSAVGAFKTIQKAVSMIPMIVNHAVIVNAAAGTYAEEISISGFSGRGTIQINGDSVLSVSRTVQDIVVTECACRIEVIGFNASRTSAAGFVIRGCPDLLLYRCSVVSSASTFGYYVDSAKVYMNECQASNRDIGVYAHVNGEILAQYITGTNCTTGYNASYGGKIAVSFSTLTATILYATAYGGTVHTQGGVLNPWGDNTLALRSVSGGVRNSGSQALTSYNWINIIMPATTNNLSEYNAVTGTFTAKQTGMYRISARVHITDLAAGGTAIMRGLVNGNNALTIGLCRNSFAVSSEALVAGDAVFLMYAGDSLVFQVNSSSNSTHDTGSFDIIREA
jgi:hypothetical protein